MENDREETVKERISFIDIIKYLLKNKNIRYIEPEINELLELRYPVLDFIQSLVKGGVTPYFEKVMSYLQKYTQLQSRMEEEVEDLLRELTTRKILRKVPLGKIVKCPECKSLKILNKYLCPRCSSDNIKHIYIFSHIPCGFTGSSSELKTVNGKTVCPKCNKELKEDEYTIRGDIFICNDCGSTFAQPEIMHTCTKCHRQFTAKDALYEDLYRYEIVVEELNKYEYIVVRDLVGLTLQTHGYSITEPKVRGLSGIEHEFLVVGVKDGKTIAIDFVREDEDADTKLMIVLGKAVDLPMVDIAILVPGKFKLSRPSEVATNVKILRYKYIDEIETVISDYLK